MKVKRGGKWVDANESELNINNIKIDASDNLLASDYANIKLVGGLTIKVFEVTYNVAAAQIEKEYTFNDAFKQQCIAVAGGAITSTTRSNILVNSTPKSKSSCLISAKDVSGANLNNITFKMIALGY